MTEPAVRLSAIDGRLVHAYGEPTGRRGDPLDALIATILSQNTSDGNSHRAYAALRETFPTWTAVRDAPLAKLEAVLRPGGLAKTKAARIRGILRQLSEEKPLNLDDLAYLDTAAAESRLLSFDGVGPKTARCVLLFALGRDVFPIDTHILRVLRRIGMVPVGMGAEKAHRHIGAQVPRGRCLALHLNLIRHGRNVCHPRKAACGVCVLRDLCAFGQSDQA